MGLALLIVVFKTIAIRHQDERYNQAARFWARIFAVNFLVGVVTGIPMEFQFRHQLVAVCAHYWRSDRPTAGHGRGLFILPGIGISGLISLRREAPFAMEALGISLLGLRRIVDFRLLHHHYQRMDAAPGRISRSAERHV